MWNDESKNIEYTFQDGDFIVSENRSENSISIFKGCDDKDKKFYKHYVSLWCKKKLFIDQHSEFFHYSRHATEKEKSLLLESL